jgi:DNA-binding CsgD family transcriptional regulator
MTDTTGGVCVADSLRDARVALRAALYDAALELLNGCEDWPAEFAEPAVILKAETIGRRDPVGAVRYLSTVADLVSSPAQRFDLAIQFGKAHSLVRAFSQAESRYAEARELAHAVPHGLATMAYHDLRMHWYRRECDAGAREAELAIAHPDPSIASAAYAFRAWMRAGSGDYAAHVEDLCKAVSFATAPTAEPVDVATLATSIHALAQVGFEMADGAAVAAARRASGALAWTPDVARHHYTTLRAFGWDAFMRGRAGEAQWAFKEARSLAPTLAWRVLAHLDRASVARFSGNEFWTAEEMAQADALAYDVQWGSTHDEERQLLVLFAVLHAPTDAPRAQQYAAMYSQIGTENVDPNLGVYGDPRASAFQRYAEGRIEQTLGRKSAAVAALEEAYRIFDAASYRFRASLAASALAELTGEERWRAAAVRHAGTYPDCPLATLADRSAAREDEMPVQLSPLQRQIARALWSGADVADLSRRFSRSTFTIQNQIATVHQAFGVTTRAELLDEARRRRLT